MPVDNMLRAAIPKILFGQGMGVVGGGFDSPHLAAELGNPAGPTYREAPAELQRALQLVDDIDGTPGIAVLNERVFAHPSLGLGRCLGLCSAFVPQHPRELGRRPAGC